MEEQVTPTRSELIRVKARIKLSQLGHKLLKMKRDGLMYELFAVLPKVKDIRANLVKDYQNCVRRLAIAQAYEGQIEIKSVAFSRRSPPTVKMGKKNIMGVVVPRVEADQVKRPLLERGYGVVVTSSMVDELVDAYEALTDQIVKAAELETTLKRLLDEVEKTKRRVNALEFKVIPELNDIKNFITLRLEEIERENIFRLKRVKAKNEANEAAANAAKVAAQPAPTKPLEARV
jgi:V/A-type H+/Na+-transporting ATPase subunit D